MSKKENAKQEVLETICELEKIVFEIDKAGLTPKVLLLVAALEKIEIVHNTEGVLVLQELLNAYQQEDYLLFLDILNYRVQPLVNKVIGG